MPLDASAVAKLLHEFGQRTALRGAIPIARGRIAVQPWVTSPDGSYCDVRVTKWTVWIWTGAGISVRWSLGA